MSHTLSTLAYLVAAVLFILALRGLSHPETSRRGNLFGMIGMGIAVVATLAQPGMSGGGITIVLAGLVIGGGIGAYLANRIQMTALPQLVAAFHSLVGLAAVCVAAAAFYNPESFGIGHPGRDQAVAHARPERHDPIGAAGGFGLPLLEEPVPFRGQGLGTAHRRPCVRELPADLVHPRDPEGPRHGLDRERVDEVRGRVQQGGTVSPHVRGQQLGVLLDAGGLAEPGRGFGPAGCREPLTAGPPQASPSHQ